MFKFKKYMGIATMVAIVAALGISSAAMAQSSTTPTPSAPTTQDAQTAPVGHRGGFGLHSQAALDAAAKALGLTADELSAQLWGGKTLSDLATEKGVDIADVQAAVQAAEKAEARTAIAAAVTAGTITQAKADWLISGLDKGYWGPGVEGGFGFGMGRGGHGGRGGLNGAVPNSNSTAPNSTPGTGTTAPSGTAF